VDSDSKMTTTTILLNSTSPLLLLLLLTILATFGSAVSADVYYSDIDEQISLEVSRRASYE